MIPTLICHFGSSADNPVDTEPVGCCAVGFRCFPYTSRPARDQAQVNYSVDGDQSRLPDAVLPSSLLVLYFHTVSTCFNPTSVLLHVGAEPIHSQQAPAKQSFSELIAASTRVAFANYVVIRPTRYAYNAH